MIACHLLDPLALLPSAWDDMRGEPLRAFNPGLLRVRGGWLLAYRLVGSDGARRIAMCRLDARLLPVPGSAVPFSDGVMLPTGTRRWFADPRLYALDGRAWMYFNTGWEEPWNHQFLQAFDPVSLAPLGPPREMLLGGRQPLEKNWTLLEDAPGLAVYAVAPHRILRYALDGDGPLVFTDAVTVRWDDGAFASRFGALRGGAPPLRVGDHLYAFCHALVTRESPVRYVAAAYAFHPRPPFHPTLVPIAPLPLGGAFGACRLHEPLNAAAGEIAYPCGSAFVDGCFVVSHGLNDEQCAITVLPFEEVRRTLREVGRPPSGRWCGSPPG